MTSLSPVLYFSSEHQLVTSRLGDQILKIKNDFQVNFAFEAFFLFYFLFVNMQKFVKFQSFIYKETGF